MSFGFSIGDVATVTQIAWNTYTALRDASEDFQGFASEVHSLHTTLVCLLEEANSPVSILQYAAPQKKAGLKDVIKNCENSLLGLQQKARKVCFLQPKQRRQFWEEFKLAFKDKQSPRDRIAIHTACINMFLSSLTHNSLGRLELLLTNVLRSPPGGFSTSSNVPRGPGKDVENAWNDVGQDLRMEGISEKHCRLFADEIKAYVRYLVHGGNLLSETNFRFDRPERERRKQSGRPGAPPPVSEGYSQNPRRRYYGNKADYDDGDETFLARKSGEREDVDINDLVHSFDELFLIDEHGLAVETVFVQPSISRLDMPRLPRSEVGSGRNSPSTVNRGNTNDLTAAGQPPRIETVRRVEAIEREKRAKAIEETRANLIKYERRKDEADRTGDRAKAADLRDIVIPDVRQRLSDLLTSSRYTTCNACLGPIIERYSHCHVCEGGDYDICKSCVESGAKCDGNHRLETREWTRAR
jgi:hypothetical protein